MQMPKQRIILIGGIVLGVMAVFMINVYLNQQRQLIIQSAKEKLEKMRASQASVLVAKNDIPRGVAITSDSLEAKIIPAQFTQPQAVTSLDRISGMVTIAPISKGEQVTLTKLSYSRQTGGLSENTPVGKRAITISVDNISSLAGMIKAGDYVDVLVIIPIPVQTPEGKQVTQPTVIPLFQNILVLAVGQETSTAVIPADEARLKAKERKEVSSPLITLALAPLEANLISFVQEQSKIRLVMRSPADAKIEPVQPTSWETLFHYLMLDKPKEEPKEKFPVVEVYRGLNREEVPLSK